MFLGSREEAFRPGKKLAATGCGSRPAFGQIRPLRGRARLAGLPKTTTAAASSPCPTHAGSRTRPPRSILAADLSGARTPTMN